MLVAGFSGHAKGVAVPSLKYRAFVDQDIIAGLDGLLFGLLHRMAGSSRQRLAIVQRNEFEDDCSGVGSIDLSERLGATRARSAFNPDNRIQIAPACTNHRFLECLCYARRCGLTQADHHRKRATQFHEATTRNSARFEHSLKL